MTSLVSSTNISKNIINEHQGFNYFNLLKHYFLFCWLKHLSHYSLSKNQESDMG